MSIRRKGAASPQNEPLCAIDQAVLLAHSEGRSWKTVTALRSEASFLRTLARAQWRSRKRG